VIITDEARQIGLTGKSAEATVASLNRDTANAQTVAQKLDVQAMKQTVLAEQTIKNGAFVTVTKLTDDAYKTMFLNGAKAYKIPPGCDNVKCAVEISPEELKHSQDEKVHVANNGIYNSLDGAIQRANQNAPLVRDETTGATGKPDSQYLVYFPQANNAISELMVAFYQKTMEPTLGLSNATQTNVNIINQYGSTGLVLDGHSRGAMTVDNAMTTVLSNSGTGGATGLSVNFFGAAANAASADNTLAGLQNVTPGSRPNQLISVVHVDDFVGTFIGGNPATGGQSVLNPDGTPRSQISEWLNILGGEYTAHNCYGTGSAGCQPYWPSNSLNSTPYPVMSPLIIPMAPASISTAPVVQH
jgi:filamentous hemagglutinin